MLKHVAPIPAIAEAITDTPDALLPMIVAFVFFD